MRTCLSASFIACDLWLPLQCVALPGRLLRFFVASAHLCDLLIRAKDLLEPTKLLLWGPDVLTKYGVLEGALRRGRHCALSRSGIDGGTAGGDRLAIYWAVSAVHRGPMQHRALLQPVPRAQSTMSLRGFPKSESLE